MIFMIDISFPPFVEALKRKSSQIIILKEDHNIKEGYILKKNKNILHLYLSSLQEEKDIQIIEDFLLENSLKIDYFFPFEETLYSFYDSLIKKLHFHSHLKDPYIKQADKKYSREKINTLYQDVPCFDFCEINNNDDDLFPLMAKPRLSHGSQGIILLKNYLWFLEFKKIIPQEMYYLEKYIHGKEISVEAMHIEQEHLIFGLTEKLKYPNSFVEKGHLADTIILTQEQIHKIHEIYHILNYENTISHTELIITENDIIYIESHPRPGGDYIPSLYENKFKENIYSIFIDILMKKCKISPEITPLKNIPFSYFPIPHEFPSLFHLSEKHKNTLKKDYHVDTIIQNVKNDQCLPRTPLHSLERPLTLKGIIEREKKEIYLEELQNFCSHFFIPI